MRRQRQTAFTLIELLVVIAVIVIIAAILFPVFAAARDKARQVTCFANLRQIGHALHLYVQDYDEVLPIACTSGRTIVPPDRVKTCAQESVPPTTPKNTYLSPEQKPPRFIQELLHPYVRNAEIWFCPSLWKERHYEDDPTRATVGYNGTSYIWAYDTNPSLSTDPNPFRNRKPVVVSGLAIAAIPRPAEAPVLFDDTPFNPVKEPCRSMYRWQPAHANGLNVLYADTHVKYNKFTGRVSTKQDGILGKCLENWWTEHNWEGYYE
jgi:prepilin-type N-terminal cleavage/methylation domain-containing protein/prepilin-type processing-associated H-X9-DG protein